MGHAPAVFHDIGNDVLAESWLVRVHSTVAPHSSNRDHWNRAVDSACWPVICQACRPWARSDRLLEEGLTTPSSSMCMIPKPLENSERASRATDRDVTRVARHSASQQLGTSSVEG